MDTDLLCSRTGNSHTIFKEGTRFQNSISPKVWGVHIHSPLPSVLQGEVWEALFSEIVPIPRARGWTQPWEITAYSIPSALCGTCSATQFRWIQKGEETEKQSWAIDHVYIGEACPKLCSGHGYCTTGAVCICDESFQGLNPRLSFLIQDRMRFSSSQRVCKDH